MADYPDWTRLFQLAGTNITIPINIETSSVILDVNLAASDLTLDVNITAASVILDFNFADQSVAVFDAAKWFAHQATQWFVNGSATIAVGGGATLGSRVVPTGKESYIVGCGYGIEGLGAVAYPDTLTIMLDAVITVRVGAAGGQTVIFDVPVRALAGQTMALVGYNGGPNAGTFRGTIWGYDEDA